MRDQRLYARLMYFPLAEAGGDFLRRLCRENNWPRMFARRAIDEYLRFVYLSMVTPNPLTPSHDVDRVWRLHLLYERSYAEMTRLLPRPFPYKPLNGGDWYERTKRFYRQEFGHWPPKHLWTSRPVASDYIVTAGAVQWITLLAALAVIAVSVIDNGRALVVITAIAGPLYLVALAFSGKSEGRPAKQAHFHQPFPWWWWGGGS